MYVLFEGLDLAGKSTVCRRFQQKAQGEWTIRANSLVADNPIFQLANQLRKDNAFSEETLGNLFHAALLGDLERFVPPMSNVIQDSTIILRSLAYHTINGTPGLPALFEALLEKHPRFDYAFVCSASPEVRLKRLSKRRKENLGPEDFLVRDAPEKFFAMEQCLIDHAKSAFGAVVIDTSNLEQQEHLESGGVLGQIFATIGVVKAD